MLETITAIAREAGAAIMEIYAGDDFAVETKADDSPLTRADRASHAVIVAGLQAAFPDIPILSEEGRDIPWQERRHWRRFWLVDPLDGTKEFIKRNGEFTVNIALVEGSEPVLGVVHVPALATTYLGRRGEGAWRERNGDRQTIRPTCPAPGTPLAVVMSRSHPSVALDAYLKQIEVGEAVPVGSSLKLCAVAEGRADLYPRLGPTMEWDTAAGQAVAEAAGARVLAADGQPLRYNKPNLLNPWFVVFGAGWQAPLPPAKEDA